MRGLLLSTVAVAATCIINHHALGANDQVMIGAATASSEWMAPYDEDPIAAVELAMDDINKFGGLLGRNLKLRHVDTKTDRAQGAKAGVELLKGIDSAA